MDAYRPGRLVLPQKCKTVLIYVIKKELHATTFLLINFRKRINLSRTKTRARVNKVLISWLVPSTARHIVLSFGSTSRNVLFNSYNTYFPRNWSLLAKGRLQNNVACSCGLFPPELHNN